MLCHHGMYVCVSLCTFLVSTPFPSLVLSVGHTLPPTSSFLVFAFLFLVLLHFPSPSFALLLSLMFFSPSLAYFSISETCSLLPSFILLVSFSHAFPSLWFIIPPLLHCMPPTISVSLGCIVTFLHTLQHSLMLCFCVSGGLILSYISFSLVFPSHSFAFSFSVLHSQSLSSCCMLSLCYTILLSPAFRFPFVLASCAL